ncbi:MAG: hypothetical protein KBT12_04230 [Bacteroidales bacterium]|nr:hypothetical protein [Candidatus Physcousia equi]
MKNFATTLEMNNSLAQTTNLQSPATHLLTATLQFLASFALFFLMLGRLLFDAFSALFMLLARTAVACVKQSRAALRGLHPLRALTSVSSQLLGEPVSKRQALHLLSFSVSGISALLFGGISVVVQLLLILWFVVSAWQCRTVVK